MKAALKSARECIRNKDYKDALKHCKVCTIVTVGVLCHSANLETLDSCGLMVLTLDPFGILGNENLINNHFGQHNL